jgi:hypothetical protein
LYEIDVRIFDVRGVPFLTQTGGDGLFEADVETPGTPADIDVEQDTAAINKNWHAAKKMIEGLKTVKFRSEFSPEYEAIINLLSEIEDSLTPELYELPLLETTDVDPVIETIEDELTAWRVGRQ